VKKINYPQVKKILFYIAPFFIISAASVFFIFYQQTKTLKNEKVGLEQKLVLISEELNILKNQDQYLKNKELEEEIKNIQKVYNQAAQTYEKLLSFKETYQKTEKLDELFAEILNLLSQKNYASAEAKLSDLANKIENEREKIATSFKIPPKVSETNNPPQEGYQRQKVKTEMGDFMVDIISADLNSTRVIVDTASDSDCANDCPVLPLADYVLRNNAFAGINGSYFCPATYPSCSNKKNAFDTLLMNKNKKYINSENNIYSTVPAVIFYGNTARFVSQSLEWGRDTSVDAVLANHPLLLLNSQIKFTGGDDPKQGSKGNRSFIGTKGNTVYIGVVHNATVAESALTLHALGLENALNLDDGGSTALWFGGYKVGPGRNIPNAVLFVKK